MEKQLIYERIAKIMLETKAITKSKKNEQQGFMFRGIDDIMNELHDIFAKNEVFIIPTVLEYTITDKNTKNGSVMYITRAKIQYKYVTVDGSYVEAVNVGEAMDSGDKGMNKAMSIALKYSLLQMLLIPTEEEKDPDQKPNVETTSPKEDMGFDLALQEIKEAKTLADLSSIFTRWTGFQSNQSFLSALSEKKKSVKNSGND